MNAMEAYAELIRRSREIATIQSCSALLSWDQQTYMPPRGTAWRGEQMAYLAGLAHQKQTDPRFGECLDIVEQSELVRNPDEPAAANVREWRRLYRRATRVPAALVEELARVTTTAQQVWQQAKPNNDFAAFRPHLERIVALKREEAAALNADQPDAPLYDALLDEYEPGASVAELVPLFRELTARLTPLVQRWALPESGEWSQLVQILERDYPLDRQRMFAESAAAAIGYDFTAGRLDVAAHPFCTGIGPGDCRITTRFHPRRFHEAFFGVLHETGHALYEMHLPAEHFGTPLGSACSLGIHESQSRLWENQVGRSRSFWEHFYPRLVHTFPTVLQDVSLDTFHKAINIVRPSLIRVEADEVTYNLHIAVRFELEVALLSGQLPVAEIPATWRDKMQHYLGIAPPDDRQGCLQDIHWSLGGFGYFPTYTLGNLYAAQFMAAARRKIGSDELAEQLRRGEFRPLREWLTEHIHRHGQRWRADTLCRRATGQPLTVSPFIDYLHEKYEPLYG